ncbi:GntR family transcriptional regulator [Actinomyces faecalis]|uniref:GntR family transcriptional regulator n=1 Tax=Actinomyces faecalis TaxID=2722820 RepID=UPI001552CFA7|nr:GntR family transcriptional regulator [Actinomyces faecalis]
MQIDDSRPIWVQLVAELRLRIVSGQWAPGSRIPSVRELASSAGVNPNTVQRALAELDRTGLTAAERTAGRFVTADGAVLDAVRAELAAEATDAYLASIAGLGMGLDEITDLLAARWPATDSWTTRHTKGELS